MWRRNVRRGFTLLEMSIVLVIVAVLTAGGSAVLYATIERQQTELTKIKMDAIQKAVLDFRRAHNRLPCPADISSYNTLSQYFGEEGTPGWCWGVASYRVSASTRGDTTSGSKTVINVNTPATTCMAVGMMLEHSYFSHDGGIILTPVTSITSSTQLTVGHNSSTTANSVLLVYNSIAGGMVPTKALNLPDDYAFDGWGRRILYTVDVRMTGTDAFIGGSSISDIAYDVTNSCTRLTVKDTGEQTKTTKAAYVLVSFGPNGHGAYERNNATRISTNSQNADELKNCHCTVAGVDDSFDGTFYQGPLAVDVDDPTNTFDDIVVYATRANLRSVLE